MGAYLFKRVLATIPVMLFVAIFIFLLLRLTPGDPAAMIAGDFANDQQIAEIRERLGLELPLWKQFGIWFGDVLRFELGQSFYYKKEVSELIRTRIEPTFSLSLMTIVLTVIIAVPMGTLAAYKQGSWFDRIIMGFSVLGFSVPVFVIGYALIYIFSVQLGWLPVQGYQRIGDGIGGWAYRLILPSVALSVIFVAFIARMTRTSVLEVLGEDYIRTARAKGLSRTQTVLRHALRNAMIPVLTILGLQFSFLLAGAIIIENVFYLPGLGRLIFQAITQNDLIVVKSVVMLLVFAIVLVNFVVDLAYAAVDPRLRARA